MTWHATRIGQLDTAYDSWHYGRVSESPEDSLRAAVTAYDEGIKQLRTDRDAAIRSAAKTMRQVDIVRVTGYNRETIRQIVKAGEEPA